MSNSLGIKIMETMFEIQGYFATDIKKHKDRLVIDLETLSDTYTCNCGAKISGNYDTRIREINYRLYIWKSCLCKGSIEKTLLSLLWYNNGIGGYCGR